MAQEGGGRELFLRRGQGQQQAEKTALALFSDFLLNPAIASMTGKNIAYGQRQGFAADPDRFLIPAHFGLVAVGRVGCPHQVKTGATLIFGQSEGQRADSALFLQAGGEM